MKFNSNTLLLVVMTCVIVLFGAFKAQNTTFLENSTSKAIHNHNSFEKTLGKGRIITLDKIPTTLEEFLEMRDKIAKTPEGGATTMIVALLIYTQNQKLGLSCLTIAVDKKRLSETKGTEGYKGYIVSKGDLSLIESQLGKALYLPNSYIKGTKVDNGYKLPSGKLVFDFSTNAYSGSETEGEIKLFIPSSGADSARPVRVQKNDAGIWKAVEWSSLIVGIRKPKVADDDDL